MLARTTYDQIKKMTLNQKLATIIYTIIGLFVIGHLIPTMAVRTKLLMNGYFQSAFAPAFSVLLKMLMPLHIVMTMKERFITSSPPLFRRRNLSRRLLG